MYEHKEIINKSNETLISSPVNMPLIHINLNAQYHESWYSFYTMEMFLNHFNLTLILHFLKLLTTHKIKLDLINLFIVLIPI